MITDNLLWHGFIIDFFTDLYKMSEKCELCDYFSSTLENDHAMSLIGVKLLIVLRFFGQIVFRRLNLCRIWAYSFYIYLYSFYLYIFVQNAANVVLPTLSVLFLELENLVLSLMFFFSILILDWLTIGKILISTYFLKLLLALLDN